MINFLHIPEKDIVPPLKEILRYCGINNMPDESTLLIINSLSEEMLKESAFRCCFEKIDIKVRESEIFLGNEKIISDSLGKNLKDCSSAYLFCATIGINADRIINKYINTSPEKGVIAQGVGAALIEAVCDYANTFFKSIEKDKVLRPRFSPGYGDFSLEHQKKLLEMLFASKNIGVTLTNSLMMVPTKSVTALIGVEE